MTMHASTTDHVGHAPQRLRDDAADATAQTQGRIAQAPQRDVLPALLRDGYAFVSRHCEALGSDAFQARLALQQVVFARGPDALATFYHPGRFTRVGAMPPTTLRLLQGRGSVQQLDGDAHLQRKRLFLSVLTPAETMARDVLGVEVIDYSAVDSVVDVLREMTGGRGPDACIDAVGMEAHGTGMGHAYDRVKQALHLHTDRGQALREAILACRKGGILSVLGVYGLMDKFPLGAVMNKGLTVRTAQQHGQLYVPRLLDLARAGRLKSSFLMTHKMPLEEAARGYEMFKDKHEGCVRAAFVP